MRLPFTLTESSVLAVIPARYHSTRFPGKVLADLAGRPMIEHVYRRAAAAALVHGTIVATDDPRIARAVEGFGGAVIMTRADHVSGTDRIAEAVATLPCRLVVNVQGDEPLLDPSAIDAAVRPLLDDPTLEMGTLCRPFADLHEFTSPHVVKVVTDDRGRALYFSRAPIPGHLQGPAAAFEFVQSASSAVPFDSAGASAGVAQDRLGISSCAAHVGLYVYRRDVLLKLAALRPAPLEEAEQLEQLRALSNGIGIRVVETRHASGGVDTPEDLERVRALLAVAPHKGVPYKGVPYKGVPPYKGAPYMASSRT